MRDRQWNCSFVVAPFRPKQTWHHHHRHLRIVVGSAGQKQLKFSCVVHLLKYLHLFRCCILHIPTVEKVEKLNVRRRLLGGKQVNILHVPSWTKLTLCAWINESKKLLRGQSKLHMHASSSAGRHSGDPVQLPIVAGSTNGYLYIFPQTILLLHASSLVPKPVCLVIF